MRNQGTRIVRSSSATRSVLANQETASREPARGQAPKGGRLSASFSAIAATVSGGREEWLWNVGPEMVLPEQYFRSGQESFATWTGERRLLFAVLEEAVASFLKYRNSHTRRGRRLFQETADWFWSDEQEWLYSFETICRHLHLEADYLRGGLRRLCQSKNLSPATPPFSRENPLFRQAA